MTEKEGGARVEEEEEEEDPSIVGVVRLSVKGGRTIEEEEDGGHSIKPPTVRTGATFQPANVTCGHAPPPSPRRSSSLARSCPPA